MKSFWATFKDILRFFSGHTACVSPHQNTTVDDLALHRNTSTVARLHHVSAVANELGLVSNVTGLGVFVKVSGKVFGRIGTPLRNAVARSALIRVGFAICTFL